MPGRREPKAVVAGLTRGGPAALSGRVKVRVRARASALCERVRARECLIAIARAPACACAHARVCWLVFLSRRRRARVGDTEMCRNV